MEYGLQIVVYLLCTYGFVCLLREIGRAFCGKTVTITVLPLRGCVKDAERQIYAVASRGKAFTVLDCGLDDDTAAIVRAVCRRVPEATYCHKENDGGWIESVLQMSTRGR